MNGLPTGAHCAYVANMKRWGTICVIGLVLTGCAPSGDSLLGEPRDGGMSAEIVRPKARPDGFLERVRDAVRPPPTGARTQEQFDTTTREQREAALEAPVGGERALGTTVASLGSPTEPGFWLKTPLVKTEQSGRVVYPVTGKSVQVVLIPIDGPPTAGSRMSLPALRLLEAPLTGLPEVQVFSLL